MENGGACEFGTTPGLVATRPEQRQQLEALAGSHSLPHGLVTRVRIILLSADGLSNKDIATRLRLNEVTVGLWRRRFVKQGVTGLQEELRPGRPRSISDEKVATLTRRTLRTKPEDGTHWSCRSLRQKPVCRNRPSIASGAFGLQPHPARHFQLSNDPFFVEKVRDIVGLYLNPPDKALVLCVDEKSQIQALERSQPMLPLGLGYVEGITHTYVRHGTTTLFAAFDPITGTVLSQCKRRHRHQEFLDFLRHVDASVPKAFDVHLIVDNYATHKHPRVQRWLAARPRYRLHFTPTYSSWLNQVEIWLSSRRRPSVAALSAASKNLWPKSNASSIATMRRPDPSAGRQRPIRSWKKYSDYVSVFTGHTTLECQNHTEERDQ